MGNKFPPAKAIPTVLVVEQDRSSLDLFSCVLTLAGYAVLAASSLGEALAAFDAADGCVDLLITDLWMSFGEGATLASLLKLKQPDLRVLFLLAEDYEGRIHRTEPWFRIATKPLSPSILVRHAKEILAGPKLSAAAG